MTFQLFQRTSIIVTLVSSIKPSQLYVINLFISFVCWPQVRMQLSFTIYVAERGGEGEGILGPGSRYIFLQNEIFKAYPARTKRVNNKERTEINAEDVMDILHFI